MEKVKIKDVKTGAIHEVLKELASDYIGTGRFEFVKEEKSKPSRFTTNKEEVEENK